MVDPDTLREVMRFLGKKSSPAKAAAARANARKRWDDVRKARVASPPAPLACLPDPKPVSEPSKSLAGSQGALSADLARADEATSAVAHPIGDVGGIAANKSMVPGWYLRIPAQGLPRRKGPCPCGSRKMFKHCCESKISVKGETVEWLGEGSAAPGA